MKNDTETKRASLENESDANNNDDIEEVFMEESTTTDSVECDREQRVRMCSVCVKEPVRQTQESSENADMESYRSRELQKSGKTKLSLREEKRIERDFQRLKQQPTTKNSIQTEGSQGMLEDNPSSDDEINDDSNIRDGYRIEEMKIQ